MKTKPLEYSNKLKEFIKSSRNIIEIPPDRLEFIFESMADWSLFNNLNEVKTWFLKKREDTEFNIEEIPLKEIREWTIDEETGNITHNSGEFFVIHGLRITHSLTREVGSKGWDQPILTQVGYDGGLLGILRKRFNGVPHYLIEAKAEPGNYEKLQLSPTLQATFSNLKRAHKGTKPKFAEYFENPVQNNCKIIHSMWMSEDGGRLHLKRNFGMLVEINENIDIKLEKDFIWLSLYQIKQLIYENALVNPHIRGIISVL